MSRKVERSDITLSRETETSFIFAPDFRYDDPEYKDIKRDGEGAALIILRNPSSPEILMGLHNSRDSAKHNRWGFFGETRKSGEETGLATLSRGLAEELNWDMGELQAFSFDKNKIFHMLDDLPRRTQYYPGEKSFMVGIYIAWVGDDKSGYIGSNEIVETRYFPLDKILKQTLDLPLREFTLTSLNKLNNHGLLSTSETPLIPVRFSV